MQFQGLRTKTFQARKKPTSASTKCKVKKNRFHSFREVQSEKNAVTLFLELKSEIKMLRDRDREVKILENSS